MTNEQRNMINEARRAYFKEWRKKNPDKVKAAQERHWLKKAQEMLKEQEQTNENAG